MVQYLPLRGVWGGDKERITVPLGTRLLSQGLKGARGGQQ